MRSDRRIRVLHVLHTLARAGVEQLVCELAVAHHRDVLTAVVCLDREGDLARVMRSRGIAVYCTDRREGFDARQIVRIGRVIRSFRPDVVHCHQYTPFFYGTLAAVSAGHGRVLFTEHGRHVPDVVRWPRRWVNGFLARRADHVTAVCRFTRSRLVTREGIPPARVEVIYNGIDVDRFRNGTSRSLARRRLGLPDEAAVIAQVATFRAVKDQPTAVRAMRLVHVRDPRAVLLFVGDGPELGACRELAERLGLAGVVRFLGRRADVPAILAAADIMLLTSLSEGHSLALLEGMAAGLPVVATDVGGVRETVVHGRTGWLVRPQDPSAVAGALLRLLADPKTRASMGRAGCERVRERFARSAMHERYLQLYRRLAARRHRP